MGSECVHGYSERESERLKNQAGALVGLLHGDTRYPPGSKVLDAGCGVGAQTRILVRNSPEAEITSDYFLCSSFFHISHFILHLWEYPMVAILGRTF